MAHPVRFSFVPTYCSMAALVFLMTAAEATASVLTDNAATYGDLLDKLAAWKAAR